MNLNKKPVAENAIRKESYESITADYILDRASKDSSIIAISPATPGVSGFTPEFRKKWDKNYMMLVSHVFDITIPVSG